ncbi:hypothetical protein T4E_2158 [Trichinella pseudospiralis]|uniref:Uncharacterized protein n=1 Tax=Trichinella pseudospiralis TaxID=6337 RepID=A0A0V0XZ27_TRIPS|nr:hypothetical protein T4E_2158 [Trichinella pseudospiralis]
MSWANDPFSLSSLAWRNDGSNDILMTTPECLDKRRPKRLKTGKSATPGGKANAITHNFAISPLLKNILPRETIPSAALNGRLYSPVFCERRCSIDNSAMKCCLDSSSTSQLENISSPLAPFSQEVVRLMILSVSIENTFLPQHITVIPCHYQTLSHSLESWTISSWKRGPEITPPAFLTHPITFWDSKSPTGVPSGEIPLQCFSLTPSHFGTGDFSGANVHSRTFCLSHYILVSLKEECGAVNLHSCASC